LIGIAIIVWIRVRCLDGCRLDTRWRGTWEPNHRLWREERKVDRGCNWNVSLMIIIMNSANSTYYQKEDTCLLWLNPRNLRPGLLSLVLLMHAQAAPGKRPRGLSNCFVSSSARVLNPNRWPDYQASTSFAQHCGHRGDILYPS
jgi:hypothetical protein